MMGPLGGCKATGTILRRLAVVAAILAVVTAAAAPPLPGAAGPAAVGPWPDRVRLVAAGTVVYPNRAAWTVHVKFDIVFVRAEAPDPSMSGGWYVPAPKSVVSQSMSSASDQWCPIKPRTAVVAIDPEQSFLKLDLRPSGSAILVGSMISAARQPEVTIGVASCNGSVMPQMPLVFQTLTATEGVLGEHGTLAPLAAGAPFPTARASSSVRMDSRSPTLTMAWTLSPAGN